MPKSFLTRSVSEGRITLKCSNERTVIMTATGVDAQNAMDMVGRHQPNELVRRNITHQRSRIRHVARSGWTRIIMVITRDSLAHLLSRTATDLRDWLLPPTCSCCGVPIGLAVPVLLCSDCRTALEQPIQCPCPTCAMPMPPIPATSLPSTSLPSTSPPSTSPPSTSPPAKSLPATSVSGEGVANLGDSDLVESTGSNSCRWCRKNRHRFVETVAWGAYRGILRTAVIRGKQDHWEPLTRALAGLLSEKLVPFAEEWKFDGIIPIPSHWQRRLKRSTNAAEVLAESIGHSLEIPVIRRRLLCRRLAEKQGTLSPTARRKNVRGAFQLATDHLLRRGGPWELEGKTILLVDDVMTTGATADEATRVLLSGGASTVFVAVVARGTGK